MYASGFGFAGIAKALNADRVLPPHGGTLGWCPTALRDILRVAELYRGWSSGTNPSDSSRWHAHAAEAARIRWLRMEAPDDGLSPEVLWEQVVARQNSKLAANTSGEKGTLLSRPRRVKTGVRSTSRAAWRSVSPVAAPSSRSSAQATRGHPRTVYACAYHHNAARLSVPTMWKSVRTFWIPPSYMR